MKMSSIFLLVVFAVSINIVIPAKAQVNVQDSLVLVDLYNSTNGTSWRHTNNWLTTPVNKWYGIKVMNARVVTIDLEYNNLTGTIPPSLGTLTYLEYLHLGRNRLSGNIPPELGNLLHLTYLDLGINSPGPSPGLSGNIPPELGKLTGLTTLNLVANKLSGAIPPEIGNLTNLTILGLARNQLSGAIPPEIGNLLNMEQMTLRENKLTGAIPTELENLTGLVYLDLSDNLLTGNIPPWLGSLTKLEILGLGYNSLSGSIPPEIGNFPVITELNLEHNRLTGVIPSEIGKLSALGILALNDNKLSGPVPSELAHLTSLYDLYLSHNRFTFSGMELIVQNLPYVEYGSQAKITAHKKNKGIYVNAGGTLSNNTYTWYKVGEQGSTTIEGDSVFHPASSGIYYVAVTNKVATQLILTSYPITYTAPVAYNASSESMAKKLNTGFFVYPNPAQNVLYIQFNGTASFSLINQAGKILLSENITNTGNINISKLPAGTYYLKNNDLNTIKKIIVSR